MLGLGKRATGRFTASHLADHDAVGAHPQDELDYPYRLVRAKDSRTVAAPGDQATTR